MSVSTDVAICRACASMSLMTVGSMAGTCGARAALNKLGVELRDPGNDATAGRTRE